jgi:hypothetical protein
MSLIRSWFSRPPAGARRRWRPGPAVAAMLATAAAAAFFAAPAASGATTASAARAAGPATPARQIATNNGPSSLCMNRDGGGTSQGTFIIGSNCGNANDNFQLMAVTGECNADGVVTDSCPFSNTALDRNFAGSQIVEVNDVGTSSCAGTSASNTFTLRLEECPTSPPAGWNSVMVAPGYASNTADCLISVHATNAYGSGTNIYVAQAEGYNGGVAIVSTTTGCNSPNNQWYTIDS